MGCGGSKTVTPASKPEVKTTADAGAPTLLVDAATLLKGASNLEVASFVSKLSPDVREKLKMASEPVTLNTAIQQLPKAKDAELIAFLSDPNLRARLKKAGLCPADDNTLGLEASMRAAEHVTGEPSAIKNKAIESNEAGSTSVDGNALKANVSKAADSSEIAMVEETADVANTRATPICDIGGFRCY